MALLFSLSGCATDHSLFAGMPPQLLPASRISLIRYPIWGHWWQSAYHNKCDGSSCRKWEEVFAGEATASLKLDYHNLAVNYRYFGSERLFIDGESTLLGTFFGNLSESLDALDLPYEEKICVEVLLAEGLVEADQSWLRVSFKCPTVVLAMTLDVAAEDSHVPEEALALHNAVRLTERFAHELAHVVTRSFWSEVPVAQDEELAEVFGLCVSMRMAHQYSMATGMRRGIVVSLHSFVEKREYAGRLLSATDVENHPASIGRNAKGYMNGLARFGNWLEKGSLAVDDPEEYLDFHQRCAEAMQEYSNEIRKK